MRVPYLLLLIGAMSLYSCKTHVPKEKYKPAFKYGNNTLLKFTVANGGNEYQFKVKLKYFADSCSFLYSMTNADRTEGSVYISASAMENAIAHDNYFSSGHKSLVNKTTVWLSRKSFNELKNQGKTTLVPNYKDSVLLQLESKEILPMMIDGVMTNLSVLKAKGKSISGEKTYWILDDPHFPLIVFMDLGWTVKLESIKHMEELSLKLKPSLFEFKPGVKLYYSLDEYGCGRDAVFELKEKNDSQWIFDYEYYRYACLYGNDDEQFWGRLIIPNKAWKSPEDFPFIVPFTDGDMVLDKSQPFFLDAHSFAEVFKKGTADFKMSHFVYEPTEEDFEFMDSIEIAFSQEAIQKAGTTRLMMKEADVETGYYMYPIEINGEEKVIETIKLEAVDIEMKALFVFPSADWPLILSHSDEDLGFTWRLMSIEY